MTARELKDVFADIQNRLGRPRGPWQQEIEQELNNFHPDYLEAATLLDALVGHLALKNIKVKACAAILEAALEDADMEPEGDEPCEIEAFKARRAKREG